MPPTSAGVLPRAREGLPRGGRTLVALASAWIALACSDPLDSPSGYESQEFWCGPEAARARDEQTAACRAADACSGWISFRGVLQSEPLTVGVPLRSVTIDRVSLPSVGVVRDAVALNADSPYFKLRWVFSDLPKLEATDGRVELPIAVVGGDGRVKSSMRLQGGGASVDLSGRSGLLETDWTKREQAGDVAVDFGSGNELTGCFFAKTLLEAP